MSIRIAINGYGRIGRNILRALYESTEHESLKIVAINDLGDSAVNAHLTEYDSVHGRFMHTVSATDEHLVVDGDKILTLNIAELTSLPWKELDIDIVFECTGRFTAKEDAEVHLQQGAKRVLVSAPAAGADATIVYGVNHKTITTNDYVISNASCTTNCLAPMADELHRHIGITQGIMTTIHAYTNDQHLTDTYSGDLYRSRAAALSMIPTKTGAARAVGLVLPELDGKISGLAVRVPTANVSLVDLTFISSRTTSVSEVNDIMRRASLNHYTGIVEYNDKPLVSVDFNHHSASCVFDSTQTLVEGDMVIVFAWYDNEWGFSNRMLDSALHIGKLFN